MRSEHKLVTCFFFSFFRYNAKSAKKKQITESSRHTDSMGLVSPPVSKVYTVMVGEAKRYKGRGVESDQSATTRYVVSKKNKERKSVL